MYWIICIAILICLLSLLAYIRRVAAKIKKFHVEYTKELELFESHTKRDLFDWDAVTKRRTNEFGGDSP
jgi:hypothetical protein